jgi:hypothetical protein
MSSRACNWFVTTSCALLAGVAVLPHAQAQDSRPCEDSVAAGEAKVIVQQAMAALRADAFAGWEKGTPDQYEAVIRRLPANADEHLAGQFRALAASGGLDRLEARLATILASRVECPQHFQRVQPYYETDPDSPMEKVIPPTRGQPRPKAGRLKPLTLDLLHPDYRLAVADHPTLFAEIQQAVNEMWNGTRALPPGDDEGWERLDDQCKARIARLEGKHGVPRETFMLLVEASGFLLQHLPRLDPAYQFAWEEGLLRTEWSMKPSFVRIVMSFDDVTSAPVLGEILRQALRREAAGGPISAVAFAWYESLDALTRRASPETLFELSETIRLTEGEQQRQIERMIGGRLAQPQEWHDLLARLEGDSRSAEHVRRLQSAIQAYQAFQGSSASPD